MSDTTFDQHEQTVSQQTNVAGDAVGRDKITISGDGNVVGDHNVVTVIQTLVQGVRRLPTDYATRIQNFLVEYLGTPELPVPFGGRAAALAELDAWLSDASAPPYLLLTAPAGRGKSALLARWSQALAQRADAPAVIFLPVSVRFRTNLSSVVFASLAARLAYLHGEEVPLTSESAEIWRGMASSYLARPLPDGRALLVILDGVDEAADWDVGADLFPATPPPGLRIVVSARHTAERPTEAAWRRALGWERPDLSRALDLIPLDRPGVADVLARMGVPLDVLARDVDVTAELHRLSAGDPLLVRLYVDDLWARGEEATRLRPEDLREIEPGLTGYFDRWWDDQRDLWETAIPLIEPKVQTVLNLLACALGLLTSDDLLTLSAECGPDCGLNTWTLEEALRPLARFILDNGKAQGYTFNHPRLGQYFYDKLAARDRAVWGGRFLIWGKQTLTALESGVLTPRNAPTYVVQYYGAHLERSGASVDDLAVLVREGWMRAWETFQGTYDGFLSDVGRAWCAAGKFDLVLTVQSRFASCLGLEALCALCYASIHSLADKLTSKLLVMLVEEGLWTPTQALAYVREMLVEWRRSDALVMLIPHLPGVLLKDVLVLLQESKDEHWRTEILLALVPYLVESGYPEEALIAAQRIHDEVERERTLATLGTRLGRAGYLSEALLVAQEIKWEGYRAELIAILAPQLPKSLLPKAISIARGIRHRYWQAWSLVALASYLSDKARAATIREALAVSRRITDEQQRARVLMNFLPYLLDLPGEDIRQEIISTISKVTDGELRDNLFDIFTSRLSQSEREVLLSKMTVHQHQGIDESTAEDLRSSILKRERILRSVLAAIRKIESVDDRVDAPTALVPKLSNPKLYAEMKRQSDVEEQRRQVEKFARFAQHLSAPLLQEALSVARGIEDSQCRADMFLALIPYLGANVRERVLREVLVAVSEIDAWLQVYRFAVLAPYLPEHFLGATLEIVRAMPDCQQRAQILAALARSVPESQRKTVFLELLSAVREISDGDKQSDILVLLAPHLMKIERKLALQEALLARKINDKGSRVSALRPLAVCMAELGYTEEALTFGRAMYDVRGRTDMLVSLIPHLSEIDKRKVLREVLESARKIKEGWRLQTVLVSLAPHLPINLIDEVLLLVRKIDTKQRQVKVLISLASSLPETGEVVLQDALKAAQEIQIAADRSEVLIELALYLPEGQREEVLGDALAAAREIEGEKPRAETLVELMPHLSEGQQQTVLGEVLITIREMHYIEDRSKVLIGLAPYLPEGQREEVWGDALAAAREIEGEKSRAETLVELMPHLSEGQQQTVLGEVLITIREMHYIKDRSKVLIGLASYLPEGQREEVLEEALVTARKIEWKRSRAKALLSLVSYLLEEQREEVLEEVLGLAQTIWSAEDQCEVLMELSFHLSGEQQEAVLRDALVAAKEIRDEQLRVKILKKLIIHLPEFLLRKALMAAREIEDNRWRGEVLAGLLPYLSVVEREAVLHQALVATLDVADTHNRAGVLKALVPQLVKQSPDFLYPLWHETLPVLARRTREDLLSDLRALTPVIYALGGDEAIVETYHAIQDVGRWWP